MDTFSVDDLGRDIFALGVHRSVSISPFHSEEDYLRYLVVLDGQSKCFDCRGQHSDEKSAVI